MGRKKSTKRTVRFAIIMITLSIPLALADKVIGATWLITNLSFLLIDRLIEYWVWEIEQR